MSRKAHTLARTFLEDAGFEVKVSKRGRGSHIRHECVHKGVDFVFTSTINVPNGDPRWQANLAAEIRRIKRAIDTKDETLLMKYLNRPRV